MAHNLATFTGATAYAYIDATPWHGLGDNILAKMRAATPDTYVDVALDAAGMRYRVGSEPMYLANGDVIKGHKASVRYNADGSIGAVFGPVGDGFTHIQQEDAVSLCRVLAAEFGCVPASTAALGDGERCFMLMRLADATITPLPGDDVRGYFLLYWGHDGQVALQSIATGVRVVCQNTLSMATAGRKAWISIRHTASAGQRLDEAAGIVRKLMATLAATGDTFASMARRNLSQAELVAFIAAAIPNTDPKAATVSPIIAARRQTIAQLAVSGKGADMANQLAPAGQVSLWGAYNGLTEYFDHVRPAEAASAAGVRNAQLSAVLGGNAELKASALTIARQLVAA